MNGNIAKVKSLVFADEGRFPNSIKPLMLYREAIQDEVSPEALEQLFAANGWPPRWRDSIYDYHHYHSTAHEALGVAAGTAQVTFGGPRGETVEVGAGDVVVIPAGVAHKREDASADFLVVGAYPPGQDWDLLRGEEGEREAALANIGKVPLPQTDPVAGVSGPLIRLWE